MGIVLILFFNVINSLDLNAQNMDGDIHLPEEFPVAFIKISQVEITGNKRTQEKVILRELDFQPGDSLATFERGVVSSKPFGQKRFSRKDSSEVVMRMKYSRANIINTITEIEGNGLDGSQKDLKIRNLYDYKAEFLEIGGEISNETHARMQKIFGMA